MKIQHKAIKDFLASLGVTNEVVVEWVTRRRSNKGLFDGGDPNRPATGCHTSYFVGNRRYHRIVLKKERTADQTNRTLLHELAHALQDEFGIPKIHPHVTVIGNMFILAPEAVFEETADYIIVKPPPEGLVYEKEADWFADTYKDQLQFIK